MISVYKYLDYRKYLRDLYDHLKATKPQFSFRYFSRKAGFASPNYLKMVMDGQRNLSQQSIIKFSGGLALKKDEAAFFESLVHFTQAKTLKEKNLYYEKLASSKAYLELYNVEKEVHDYFSNWQNVAIYEMVHLKEFRNDPTWIACHMEPNITIREAQQALENLQQIGLIEKDGQKLVKTKGNLETSRDIQSVSAMNFHKAMIQKGMDAMESVHYSMREISSLTAAVPEKRIPEVKEMLQNFTTQLHAMLQEDKKSDFVYQVNVQMFPLTKKLKDKKK